MKIKTIQNRAVSSEPMQECVDLRPPVHSLPPGRMILDGFEVEKQRENETKKGAHTRFELGTSKSMQKLSFSMQKSSFPPASPPDFTPRVWREWKEKKFCISSPVSQLRK